MRQLHLDLSQRRTTDSVCRDVRLLADGETAGISVVYEIFDTTIGDLPVLDGLVQGVLLYCMKRGLPLRVHGNLSRTAAYNLQEFQRVWALWRPGIYRQVDLIPDAIVTEQPRSARAIQAFSGGVDANFTLVSNKLLNRQRGGYDVEAAMLVHGFDVTHDNSVDFNKLVERVRKTLDRVGVDIKIVRTNSRLLNIQSWMDSHTAQLAACLHHFSNQYGKALMGSSSPYNDLHLPNSSNPITDPLLSGDLMAVIHDGAGYSRTEKVAAICEFPFLIEQLKVCWEGRSQHDNCGSCEKCLRTRLNFAAVGHNQPSCFPGPFNTTMLAKLRARSAIQVGELEAILTYLRRRNLSYPWVKALRYRIAVSRLLMLIDKSPMLPRAKSFLRNVLPSRLTRAP